MTTTIVIILILITGLILSGVGIAFTPKIVPSKEDSTFKNFVLLTFTAIGIICGLSLFFILIMIYT